MKAQLYQNANHEWTLVKPNGAIYRIIADLNVNTQSNHFKSTQVIVTQLEGFVKEGTTYSGGTLLHEIPKFLMHTFFKLIKRKENDLLRSPDGDIQQ
jgi:hypothetical protein